MKKIILLSIILIGNFIAKSSVYVQTRNGVNFITHKLNENETIFQLSKDYSLRPNVLAKFNELAFSTNLSKYETIDIPLTETNFFKFASLDESGGFIPILYKIENTTNSKFICSKFQIEANSFHKWNESTDSEMFENGDDVIIGWLKYSKLNQTSSLSTPKNEVKTQTKPTFEEKKIVSAPLLARPVKKYNSPTLAEDTKDAIKKIGELFKSKPKSEKAMVAKPKKEKAQSQIANPKIVSKDPKRDKESIIDKSKDWVEKIKNKIIPEKNETSTSSVTSNPKMEKPKVELKLKKEITPKKEVVSQNGTKQSTTKIEPTIKQKESHLTTEYTPTKSTKKESYSKTDNKLENVETSSIENSEIIAEEEPKIVNTEIKKLSFSNSKSGKAAYFFAGPSGGKFYVVTSLASKGKMIKITNTSTGKSIIAEVLSALPPSDASKGLLIKISDNAKLPLKQTQAPFIVNVNY